MNATLFTRRLGAAACCAVLLAAAGAGYGADAGLLELERMRLQREQRADELRLRLDHERRAQQLQQYDSQRRTELQPPAAGQLRMQTSSEETQRRMQLDQLQSQERLSQQLLHQDQERRLRHRLLAEPDAVARGQLDLERRRFMRQREGQLRQFGTYTR